MTCHFGRLSTTCLSLLALYATASATAAVPARLPAGDWRVGQVDGASGVAVAFSGDGTKLLTAGGDEARVWDARTLRPLTDALKHPHPVRAAVISPDGTRVVTAAGTEVRLWEVATGRALHAIAHPATVHDAAFSPDGSRFVTGCGEYEYDRRLSYNKVWEGAAQVWDAATGERLLTLTDRAPVRFVGFDPTGKLLYGATGGADAARYGRNDAASFPALRSRHLLVWDASTGEQMRHVEPDRLDVRNPPSTVFGRPAFSPDGTLLAYCCNTAYLAVVIDARDGTVQAYPAERQDESYPAFGLAAFGPPVDGALRLLVGGAALGRGDRAAQVVALGPDRDGFNLLKERRVFGIADHDEHVTAAALSPDGRRVAVAGHTRVYGQGRPEAEGQRAGAREWAGVWDVASGERLLDTLDGRGDAVLAFSAAGHLVAIGYPGGKGENATAVPHTAVWRVP